MLELKEYQKEASEIIEDKFSSGVNRTSVIWPTGLGKTIVPIDIMRKHLDKKFLVIAPRHSIISQTKEYMQGNGISEENAMFYTYGGLSKMNEELMAKLKPDYIILDEMHRAGAQEWGKGVDRLLEKYPEANALGLTATPTRMDGKNMVEEKFNGDIAHEITLEEAIARGLLKMPKSYINAIYSLDGEIGDIEESISRVKDEEERQRLEAKLETVKRKLQESKGLPEIFAERMSVKNGKYIIFCKDIAHMHEMMEKAKEMFKGVNENIEIYDISSEKNNLQNEREIKHFKENNSDSLKLLYSVDMFNEGLHIENAGIIMFRPTASWIVYLQQLGRTLGIEESGEIFDIVNNSRSSKDIYQFYETIKEIQEREKIEGLNIDFTIYDEVRGIQELLEEINESMHIDKYSFKEKIEYLNALKKNGLDLSKIKRKDKSKEGINYGHWISNFRTAYNKGELSQEAIKEITNLGIGLEKQLEMRSYEEKIAILKKLQEKGVDLSTITQRYKTEDGENVGHWVQQWKNDYSEGKLSQQKVDELKEFKIDVLKKDVVSQRARAKATNTEEKIEYLKELQGKGIDLSQIKTLDRTEDGIPIGAYVSKLRKEAKNGNLSNEQIEKLEAMGINLQSQMACIEEKIEFFKKLKEEGVDLSKVRSRDEREDGRAIGKELQYLRRLYKEGILSKEQIESLEELGIKLESQRIEGITPEKKIEIIVEQIEKGINVAKMQYQEKTEDGIPIKVWIGQLAKLNEAGKLKQEDIEKLTNRGISLSLKRKAKQKEQAEGKLEQAKESCEQFEQLLGENQKKNEEK